MFHPGFHSQAQQQPAGFHSMRNSMNFFHPSHSFFFRSPIPNVNQSTQNLNISRDFERLRGQHHGFTSIPSGGSQRFFDFTKQKHFDQQRQRWRMNAARAQAPQQRRMHAFHFQDKATSYFMSDPIRTSDDRITIQLTKVHVGPNGDQQRVFVEQDFSNETELSAFVQNLRQNFEKAFSNRGDDPKQTGHQTDDSTSNDSKKSGVVVVEEPDEEPKIYQQHVYNANIESKKAAAAAAAAASLMTPPLTPSRDLSPSPKSSSSRRVQDRDQSHDRTTTDDRQRRSPIRTPYMSPSASYLSSSSTARSYRRRKNKMKYRRQQAERAQARRSNIESTINSSRSTGNFQMPTFTYRYQATPPPFHTSAQFHPSPHQFRTQNNMQNSRGGPFAWHHPFVGTNGQVFQNSRSFVRPRKKSHVDHQRERGRFTPHPHTKDFASRLASPFRFQTSQRRKQMPKPTTVTDHLRYPNHEQQIPRVHRTKSECQQSQKSEHRRSRSAAKPFPDFSPIHNVPIIQRHFIPFCSPPIRMASQHLSTPLFYPDQTRRQFGSVQIQFGLLNPFRLGSTRF